MQVTGTTERSGNAMPPMQRVGGIDGLRAISIIIVLAGHGSSTHNAPEFLAPMRNMGIVGVELFFAISGFVITLMLLRERQGHGFISLRLFWARRALRIRPPFSFACAGIALAAALGVMEWHWSSLWGAVTFTKNLPLFSGDWFFGHFWSLSVEEQFYLCWPLLFAWLVAVDAINLALLGLLLAGPAIAVLCTQQLTVLQNLLPYIPYLAVGALLASLRHGHDRRFFSRHDRLLPQRGWLLSTLLIAAVACSWLRNNHHWNDVSVPLDALLMPATIFFILFEATAHDGALQQLLDNSVLRALGRISYSVYLWQQLFLGPPDAYPRPWLWNEWPLNMAAGIACGALGYLLVERPCARLRAKYL